jgi:hypothetical protein
MGMPPVQHPSYGTEKRMSGNVKFVLKESPKSRRKD